MHKISKRRRDLRYCTFLRCAKSLSYNGNVCEKCIKCIRKTWDSRQLNKRLRKWYSGHINKTNGCATR